MINLFGPTWLMWTLSLASYGTAGLVVVRIWVRGTVAAWLLLTICTWTGLLYMAFGLGLLPMSALLLRSEFGWGMLSLFLFAINLDSLRIIRAARAGDSHGVG